MKLKNSYILLIAMAIFLLVSIGSVCASENTTADSDDALATTDVVLADEDILSEDATQGKINTTTTVTSDKEKFGYDDEKTITVNVSDNESKSVSIDANNLTVFEGSNAVNFTYNNSKITILDKLAVGNHSLIINYLGNNNTAGSSGTVLLKIFGNYTIITDELVYSDGKKVEIPVKVFDGVEYLPLDKNNMTLTLTYTNEIGKVSSENITNYTIDNGKIKYTADVKLLAANITVNYTNAAEPKTVGIRVITNITATADKDKYKASENKTISVKLVDGQNNPVNITKSELKVLENGANVGFEYNNSVITITEISEGAHKLTITYLGNNTYNSSSTQIELNVYGANQVKVPAFVDSDGKTVEIPIYIFNGLENITINKDNLTLKLTCKNETGNTTVNITGFELNNGTITFNASAYNLNSAILSIDYIDSTGAKTVNIRVNSNITAVPDKIKYRFNETNNITVTVFDDAGNAMNVTADYLKVFDNGKEIAFTYNNSIITVKLDVGVHNVTVTYIGNDTYNASSTTIEQKVFGDVRFDPSNVTVLDESNNAVITINLNDGADPVEINATKLNIVVFYSINNQTFNKTVAFTVSGQNVTFPLTEDFNTAYAEIKYAENNLTAKTDIKVNTIINASDFQRADLEVKNFTINVTATNGHYLNITQDKIKVFNNGVALNIEFNNSLITIKDALKAGSYNLTIKYLGEDAYLESVKNIILTVYGINITTSINVNSSKQGEVKIGIINGNSTVNITKDDLILNVTYKDGNDTKVIKITDYRVENGTLIFILENGDFTTATLNIKYNNTEANVTLNRIFNVEIQLITTQNEYLTGEYKFKLVDVDDPNTPVSGRKFSLTVKSNISTGHSTTTDSDGIATFKSANIYVYTYEEGVFRQDYLTVGTHTVELATEGNVKSTTVTTNLTVTKGNYNIKIDSYKEYFGSTKPVTITVTNSKNEPVAGIIVKLTISGISGTYYLQTNGSGVAQIRLYNSTTKVGLVGGKYTFTATNNDTVNIAKTTGKATVTIVKIPVKITGKNVKIYYNSKNTYTFKVTKNGKALANAYVLVKLYTSSKKYQNIVFQTNKKGKVTFRASLNVGKHKIKISMADNRYKAKTLSKTITVKKAKAKFKAPKVNTYYNSGKYFTAKLTNTKTKTGIYYAKVQARFFVTKNKYQKITGYTGIDGKFKLSLENLKPGSYKIQILNGDKKNYDAKKVTSKIVVKKSPTKLVPKKVSVKKGAKKYFKVTAKNKKTKKGIVGIKLKVKVYTGKSSKTYTVKTNKKGVAKLSTAKLKVGKHKVVVSSANKYCKAKKAKSTITVEA